MLRVAVVTPYYQEPTEILAKCLESVRQQNYPCLHILVCDGGSATLPAVSEKILQLKLPTPSRDWGNTPRALGGLLAQTQGVDAIAYLDADNWFEPDHIEKMVRAHEMSRAPVVACKRQFFTYDERLMGIFEFSEARCHHVDTSCYMLFRPAFALLSAWMMPKPVASICDRVFFAKLLSAGQQIHFTDEKTVCYRSRAAAHYHAAGLPMPHNVKGQSVYDGAIRYMRSPEGRREIIQSLSFDPVLVREN